MSEKGSYGEFSDVDMSTPESVFYASLRQFMGTKSFCTIVRVVSVTLGGDGSTGFVDIIPLVTMLDGAGSVVQPTTIYNAPFSRLQGGVSAIVIDPVVGDLGVALFADRDISAVKSSKKSSPPGSLRRNSSSDAIYLGGLLNGVPSQYIKFINDGGGIEIKTPGNVNINGLKVLSDGRLQLVDGSIVDKHTHGGVESGGSNTAPLGG